MDLLIEGLEKASIAIDTIFGSKFQDALKAFKDIDAVSRAAAERKKQRN